MSDDDFEPRPNDYLVEPMFTHLEPRGEGEAEPGRDAGEEPEASGLWARLLRFLRPR